MDYYTRPRLLTGLINFAIWLTELILVLRIVLRLFSANPDASFVSWIYTTSNTLLEPFRGIFPTGIIHKGFVIDFTALFAVIIYAIIGAALVYLVAILEHSITLSSQKKQ